MNICRYIDIFVNKEEKRINRRLGLAKGDKGYVSGHALFIHPILRRQARILAKQNAAAIPPVVAQESPPPPPPPKELSGSNVQVGDNYSVPTKSKSTSDNNESPVPESERWYNLGCPGLVVNGVINRNVIRNFDKSLLAARIIYGLGSAPKAQREPKAFNGLLCSDTYLNGTCCIAEVSRDGDICEFHREGKLREVRCTSFTKVGLQCKITSYKMRHYSQQQEWGYLCEIHGNSMLQRGHLYRSGMPASLLARVEISPFIFSKDLEDQKEHNDLTFELSLREEIIITAVEFNAPETVDGEKTWNHLREKKMESSVKNASRKDMYRIFGMRDDQCKVDTLSLRAFPKDADNGLGFVYLLEKIMHTIF
ncbi:hypothetical protein BGZ83_003181, partial [Gryganskiella cystojenkinii]